MIRVTDSVSIREAELDERFVRSSGPGGQNVNKVSTAVELRFDIGASSLAPAVKARLLTIGGRRVSADGVLIIDSRAHRTQAQNREAARARLAALVARATYTPRPRTPTTPGRGARERRLTSKKRRGAVKARRGSTDREEE